jgi:hypothetical protein
LGAKYFYSTDDDTNFNLPKVKEFRRSAVCILEGQIVTVNSFDITKEG